MTLRLGSAGAFSVLAQSNASMRPVESGKLPAYPITLASLQQAKQRRLDDGSGFVDSSQFFQ